MSETNQMTASRDQIPAASETAAKGFNWLSIFKESIVAALVAFALSVIMIGIKTVDSVGGLTLQTRWQAVAIAVVAVFCGRFLLALWRQQRAQRSLVAAKTTKETSKPKLYKVSQYLSPVLLGFAIIFPFLFTDNGSQRLYVDIATYVAIYVMLGWGLNIVVGLAGLLDLGYVAFYAVGAYSYALSAHYFGWSFWLCLPMAGLLAATFGMMLGFPVLRLRGDYLAIVTLGFGEIIRVVLLNWYEFTGGPNGLSQIPRPDFFGLEFAKTASEGSETFSAFFGFDYSPVHRIIFLYYLILALALLTNWFTLRIRKLPIGRAWEALREDEIACRSLGINPTNTKLTAFAIGAMFGGFAGSFFAARQGFISPESFTFMESAQILAIVVLGGLGSQFGVALAALIIVGGTEAFREFEEYRMLTFGMLMVAIMVWRPRGLFSFRKPTVLIPGKRVEQGVAGEGHG